MSEELNKELENEVTEEVKEAAPMETMEDYAAELEASYKTLNQRDVYKRQSKRFLKYWWDCS